MLEERASACVTVVSAIATVLYSITRETPKVSRCVAANCSRGLVDQEVDPSLAVVDGVAIVAVMLWDMPSARPRASMTERRCAGTGSNIAHSVMM